MAEAGLRPSVTGLTPLVGRGDAVATLAHEWDLARAGHGRTVLMTGEPGVGKSRLALQLRELVAGDDPLWIEGSCSSYTRMSVLRPVIDLMEDALSFHDDADPDWRLARIRAQLAEAEVDVTDGDELIARLLGIPNVPASSIER